MQKKILYQKGSEVTLVNDFVYPSITWEEKVVTLQENIYEGNQHFMIFESPNRGDRYQVKNIK